MTAKEITGRELRQMIAKKKKGETVEYFRENLNSVYPPWDIEAEIVPRKKRVRIKRLAHTTHKVSYDCIHVSVGGNRTQDKFKFRRITGKSQRSEQSSSRSYTYKQSWIGDKFKLVSSDQELIPGYYSWWEVDFATEDRQQLLAEVIQEYGSGSSSEKARVSAQLPVPKLSEIAHKMKLNLPSYIKGEGFHGPWKFSVGISTLIKRYREAREKHEGQMHNIILRFAGTLRYKYLASSMVIIYSESDTQLRNYKPLSKLPRRFNAAQLVDQNEHVQCISDDQHIDFNSESITTMRSKDYARTFHHQAAFAFYSPSEEVFLSLEEGDGEWTRVRHPLCATSGRDCTDLSK